MTLPSESRYISILPGGRSVRVILAAAGVYQEGISGAKEACVRERIVAASEDMAITRPEIRQLFKAEQGAVGNVVLNWSGSPKSELALIGEVYHAAARQLVDVFSKQRAYSDLDAYPIVFLYRHALELLIKAVLTIGNHLGRLLERRELQTRDLYNDHSLARHIERVRLLFETVGWPDAFEQAGMRKGEFEQVIAEFEQFDPGSLTFRYPMKKDGTASLSEKHFVFSPKQFADTLDPILNTLSGACMGLEEYRRMLAEAQAGIESQAYADYAADYLDYEPEG